MFVKARVPLTIISLVVSVSLQGCVTSVDYVTGQPTLNTKPVRDDVLLGTQYTTLVLASAEAQGLAINPNNEYTRIVQAVMARIMAVPENRARMPPFPWSLSVIERNEPNAWCFAGGQIIVLTGLLESGVVRNVDEIAMILGHEIAHAAARHATERSSMELFRKVLGPLGEFFGPKLVALATNVDISTIEEKLAQTEFQFDHTDELEADLIGLEFMSRAGFSAHKGIDIWRRLSGTPAHELSLPISKNHPPYKKRLSELEKHLPAVSWIITNRTSTAAWQSLSASWVWKPALKTSVETTRSLQKRSGGRRPDFKVFPLFMEATDDLITVSTHLDTKKSGNRPVLTVQLRFTKDFVESNLPLHISYVLERLHPTSQSLVESRNIVKGHRIDADELDFTHTLPRLFRGDYRLTVLSSVGSLRRETSRLISIN